MTPDGLAAHSESGPLKVLVVDDDQWTTRAVNYALITEPGFTPLPAVHTGADAVKSFLVHRPDVTLMDINMPGELNGIAATREIRKVDPQAVIIILSTISPGPGIARALEAGAVAAVSKSASEATLRSVVRQAARGEDPTLFKSLARDIVISGDALPEAPVISPQLSTRELEVLMGICQGLGYEEIAQAQGIAPWTVKTHTKHLREKLYAENLAQLVVRALQFRYLTP